ncbi:acylneuraminate cytidylyltransferase family protein [Paenibacillus rhizoplanae]|uniref:Cytidylyltransferase domain-containing protein n=1 Tax=Paenibacillus rhizoplanae TaxID=1917181 RepID=A0ABW5FD36_9BACL
MIDNRKVLAIIPARGGSKGIPRKNIKQLAGKPLIAWTIEEAKKSRYIDRLILSSEDSEIIEIAGAYGCEAPFVRPKELSEDITPGIAPVLHAITQLPDFDYVVLLQPTSPLRLIDDIDGCIEHMVNIGAPACVSVTKPDKSPYWMYTLKENCEMKQLIEQSESITRRQELPEVYALNGAVYVADVEWLLNSGSFLEKETVAYEMSKGCSYDIDTEEDFFIIEYLLSKELK